MKIGVVSSRFLDNRVAQNRNQNQSQNQNYSTQPKLNNLQSDTVSFGAGIKVFEVVEQQLRAKHPTLQEAAEVYLEALARITDRLSHLGFTIDMDYCSKHVLKSVESSIHKMCRYGCLKITDPIRASIMNPNLGDLSLLSKGLIPELEAEGYKFAPIDMHIKDLMKRGYIPTVHEIEVMENLKNGVYKTKAARVAAEKEMFKAIPDLDIRMKGASKLADSLPEELKYSAGEPPKAFLYDIQGKLIRINAKERHPLYHELIILPGPETQRVKTFESASIYQHTRAMGELHVDLDEAKVGTDEFQIKSYIGLIREMLTGKISAKLFTNAKNKDLGIPVRPIDIVITEKDVKDFNDYFKGLNDSLSRYYKKHLRGTYARSERRQIGKDFNADLKLVENAYNELAKTMEFFKTQTDMNITTF